MVPIAVYNCDLIIAWAEFVLRFKVLRVAEGLLFKVYVGYLG
jgi:hypothetical protein